MIVRNGAASRNRKHQRDVITAEERLLIDEAVNAGRVKVIPYMVELEVDGDTKKKQTKYMRAFAKDPWKMTAKRANGKLESDARKARAGLA